MSKSNLYCVKCGFRLKDVSTYWLKLKQNMACPVCGSLNAWKKAHRYLNKPAEFPDNELWKSLLIAMNPTRFRKGTLGLTRNWKEFGEYMKELRERNPELYRKVYDGLR